MIYRMHLRSTGADPIAKASASSELPGLQLSKTCTFVLGPLLSLVHLPLSWSSAVDLFSPSSVLKIVSHASHAPLILWARGKAHESGQCWISCHARVPSRLCDAQGNTVGRPVEPWPPSTASPEARNPWVDTREWSRSYAFPNKLLTS